MADRKMNNGWQNNMQKTTDCFNGWQNTLQKLQIKQHETHYKMGVNSGIQSGKASTRYFQQWFSTSTKLDKKYSLEQSEHLIFFIQH